MQISEWTAALLSGAVAGLSVDISLFPVDTVKTRLQSKAGFFKAGGFQKLYAGIGPVILGSAPGAAVFFAAYEKTKNIIPSKDTSSLAVQSAHNMFAASVGEVAACGVRVPVEVVKQRAQVGSSSTAYQVFRKILKQGGFQELYRGYRSTVLREIPFSIIQFPIWEILKLKMAGNKRNATPLQSAVCGFFSGGFAAGVTTPLDVAKTRIMLANSKDGAASGKIIPVLLNIYKTEGIQALFAGVIPRIALISIGGFIFLGSYDLIHSFVQ